MEKKGLRRILLGLCIVVVVSFNLWTGLGGQESPGELSKVHGELKGANNCIQCHTAEKKLEPARCLNCHKELALRIKTGRGYHKDKKEDCNACHQEHNGEKHSLVQWNSGEFDHWETGFQLSGSHQQVKTCDQCHTPDKAPPRKYSRSYFLKDNRCSACHKDPHRGNQPNCSECHTAKDWSVDIW